MRKNGHTKEIRLLPGYALELLLSTPNDSLITYYEHKMEGKLISSTDSTLTLAVTGNYRYISYANGSWLEDYFDYSADSAILKTFHLDSVSCLYSSREWLRYPRKVSMNLTRIFIGVSLINSISGNGSITNSVLFLLGVAGIYGEFALGGKKLLVRVFRFNASFSTSHLESTQGINDCLVTVVTNQPKRLYLDDSYLNDSNRNNTFIGFNNNCFVYTDG